MFEVKWQILAQTVSQVLSISEVSQVLILSVDYLSSRNMILFTFPEVSRELFHLARTDVKVPLVSCHVIKVE